MCINFSTIVTRHGKLRTYFHRFKIIEDLTCLCKMSPQTTDHLLRERDLLKKQRQVLRNSITKAGGNWPIKKLGFSKQVHKIFSKVCEHYKF